MISKRLTNVSCDKECFDKATPDNNALKKTATSTKVLNSHHDFLKEENTVETFYDLTHHLAPA